MLELWHGTEEKRRDMLADHSRRMHVAQVAALSMVLLVCAWLRVESHDWDDDQHINVDELSLTKTILKRVNIPPGATLSTLLDPQTSPFNPRAGGAYFVYGTLPLYLVKAVSSAAATIGGKYFNGLDGILQTGRVVSGLLDTITALLLFAVGARLWGAWQGILACAFYALAALPIQAGHFFISDPFMSLFMAATLLCSILFCQRGRARFMLLAGVCAGLAVSCKFSAAPVVVLPVAAAIIRGRIREGDTGRGPSLGRVLSWIGMALGAAVLGFVAGDPFALLDAPTYLAQLSGEAAIQGGATDEWFTRKYVGTWPVGHQLGQLLLLGVGPLVGLAGLVGTGIVAMKVFRERTWAGGLLLIGAGFYFAPVSTLETKWVRYLLPLVPYLCLFATAFAIWSYELGARRDKEPLLKGATAGVLLFSALLGAVAVDSVFTSEHTQVRASRWIYSNIPPGSQIGIEEDALEMPLPLPGYNEQQKGYTFVKMNPLADMSSLQAADTLHGALRKADYLVIDWTQAASTVTHLPWRYPVQIRYYELLLNGRLGFSTAMLSTSFPRIGDWQIDDRGWADLSFMDSSHPPIYVLKKVRDVNDAEWNMAFADASDKPSVASRRRP